MKKLTSTIILTLLFLPFSYGQKSYPSNSLIIHVDPGIGSLPWQFNTTTGTSHSRKPWFNFAAGINYERHFNQTNSLIIGIDVQSIGDKSIQQYGSTPPNGDSLSIYRSESKGHLYLLAIPLVYNIGKTIGKFRIGGLFGIINSFGVGEGTSTWFENYKGEKTTIGWKASPIFGFVYYLDAKIGLSLTYLVNDNFSIGLEPYTRLNIYTPSNYRPFFNNWNVLFALNFKYTFSKKK